MKDRPQSSVYVPPHQRLRSVITIPPSSSPIRTNDGNDNRSQVFNSSSNPDTDVKINSSTSSPVNNPIQSSQNEGHFQFSQQKIENLTPKQQRKELGCWNPNSFHYKFYTPPKNFSFQFDWQFGDSQQGSGVDEASEEGLDREFGQFEPSAYPTGCQLASVADNVEQWKLKFYSLLRDQNKQELISREKKDRRDFEQIADVASRMGLFSHSYVKVVVFSKTPLPNYRFDLDEKRPLREVAVDLTLHRKVDAYIADYLAQKSKCTNAKDNALSRSSSSGSIATDEGLFEQPEPLNLSSSVMERILRRRNLQLRDQQLAWQECPDGRKMLEFRRSLPAFKERDALLTAIASNQVIIISGETGCGKTTQIPQFILESEIDFSRGSSCSIICTQPRRISAMSVAERVATERGEKLGESVGYKVRLEGMKGRDTRLLFCTTGILLRRLLVDRTLKGISHVIVDEIHERGMNEDFLLIVLKELLPRRPELKLILMSATLDADLFSSYFGGAPVINIPGFTYPVRTHFLEDILELSGYTLTPYNQIDDYGSDRSWKMNKQGFRKRKSQIASVVEDALAAADFREYSAKTRDSLSCWNPDSMGFNLIENLLCNIWENEGPSAVLVCMTGWDDISSLRDKLKAHPFMGDPSRVLLIACHSSMASLEQRLIFEKPEDGVRKIVLATNIAETSITIYDVVFVVDCGKAKETSYDALNNTPCLLSSWISKVKFGSVRKFILFIYCSLFIKDEQSIKELPASAHTIGNDSWQQVSLMLITSFNCGWVLSFSKLMMVPMGWAWGITSLLLVGFFSCYSSWVLAGFHFIEGQRFIRYRDIMGFLFGKKLYYITYMLQFSTFILGNMGFILLGGKALKEINLVFSDTAMRLQYFIIITGVIYCTFAFVVPNLSSMRLWLGASVIFTFSYIGVLLVFTAKDAKSVANRDYEVRGSELAKVFNALGAIAAMIVSNNSGMIPEIQSTLQKPAVRNLRIAVCMQYTLGLMVYYGVSIAGYWIYGSAVPEYLPKALSGPKWAKVLINSAVFLQNVISQHMFFQPVHEALDTKFLRVDEPIYSRENLKRRFFLRTLVFTGNTLVTAAIPFMGDFINLLGSFTLITLTFIFPSMIFIKVKAKTAKTGHKAWHWILIVVFSLLAIATTISAARLIINNVRNYRLFANQ